MKEQTKEWMVCFGLSAFVGYLIPKLSVEKNSCVTHNRGQDKEVHSFRRVLVWKWI